MTPKLWTGLTLILAVVSAMAEPTPLPKREITLPAHLGTCENLVTVPAPPSRCAVVSEKAGILAVAHQSGTIPQVSLFALDGKGQLKSPTPVGISLPKPTALGTRVNYPLAVAAHPKLPLLYVWQDIAPAGRGEPADNYHDDGFCHLLIYDLKSGQPELVQSLAQGEEFPRSNIGGGIALDASGHRLFVPNLRRPAPRGGTSSPAVGYFRLNDAGLADAEDADDALQVPISDSKKNENQPVRKKLPTAARKAAKAAGQPTQKEQLVSSKHGISDSPATFPSRPTGFSFFPVTDTVCIVAGPLGPVTWDEENRRGQFSSVTLPPARVLQNRVRLAGHPSLPVVFFSGVTTSWVYRMEHADGFMTLLPQRGTLEGALLTSAPVIMPKRHQFVCGGQKTIYVIGFDEQGALNGERIDVPVNCPSVEAVAYSNRFDKLYVAVDKPKP